MDAMMVVRQTMYTHLFTIPVISQNSFSKLHQLSLVTIPAISGGLFAAVLSLYFSVNVRYYSEI